MTTNDPRWSILKCWIFHTSESSLGNTVIVAIEDRALILKNVSLEVCRTARNLQQGKEFIAIKTNGIHLSIFGEVVDSYRSCKLMIRRDGIASVFDGGSHYSGMVYDPPVIKVPDDWKTKKCKYCKCTSSLELEKRSLGYYPCHKAPLEDLGLHDWVYDEEIKS